MASFHDATRPLNARSGLRRPIRRRSVLKGFGFVSAGLLLGAPLGPLARAQAQAAGGRFGAWLHIAADNRITVIVCQSEMGQGIYTSLPALVAEELDCDLAQIDVRAAPADAIYRNTYLVKAMMAGGNPETLGPAADWALERMGRIVGQQVTGGSTSVRWLWQPLRRAGAEARMRLVQAAAQRWSVMPGECRTEAARVHHQASGRSFSYGELAEVAAALPVPENVALRPAAQWRLIGKSQPRYDTPAKITGAATYGIDVRQPGQLYAAVQWAPAFGAKLTNLDASKALALPGIKAVVPLAEGFAVVAEGTWAAMQAREAVQATWSAVPEPNLDSAMLRRRYERALDGKAQKAHAHGDAEAGLAKAATVIGGTYHLPFLAHATMEPMNATAKLNADGSLDVWAPTQAQDLAVKAAASVTGLGAERIRIHTTYLGGGFGRRAEADFIAAAVAVARALPGTAVQTLWPRPEDMRRDYFRPASLHRVRAGLDAQGRLTAWRQEIVCPSIMKRVFPPVVWLQPDETAVEGAAEPGYAIPDLQIGWIDIDTPVPVGFWRSVGHSHTAFVKETMIDQAARAAKRDPLAYRRELAAHSPRHLAVLDLVAAESGWGTPAPAGTGRGVALHSSFGAIVAMVAEVIVENGAVKLTRLTCAADIGTVLDPRNAAAQIEGAAVFGLTAALQGEITIKNGAVEQGNYDDYPMLTLTDIPPIAVHFVKSDATPGGAGEPGVPPVAPAVANAVQALTGERMTALPIRIKGKPST